MTRIYYNKREVFYSPIALTGAVCGCYKIGVDFNTGVLYYKDEDGNWAPVPSGGGGVNIYNSDGVLTGDRILDGTGQNLSFIDIGHFFLAGIPDVVTTSKLVAYDTTTGELNPITLTDLGLDGFIPITGTTVGNNVTGNVTSDFSFFAESFSANQNVTAVGAIISGTPSQGGFYIIYDGANSGNTVQIGTLVQSGSHMLNIPDLNGSDRNATLSVGGIFADIAGNIPALFPDVSNLGIIVNTALGPFSNSYVTITADATAGSVTLTITPSLIGQVINIKKLDASANPVIVAITGVTIDGQTDSSTTTQPLTNQWDSMQLQIISLTEAIIL